MAKNIVAEATIVCCSGEYFMHIYNYSIYIVYIVDSNTIYIIITLLDSAT